MEKRTLTYDELMLQFQNQVWFLIDSCNAFDQGRYPEAIRLAATLRILLHDTRTSKSLLGQLGVKTNFFDTSQNFKTLPISHELKSQTSELRLISTLMGNSIHQYKPHFGSTESLNKIDFDGWWDQFVIVDMEGVHFSRSRIILSVANKDGGAHVDPELEEDYYKLTRLNSTQHFFTDNVDFSKGLPETIAIDQLKPIPSPLPVFYTIRQIAHEVLISKIDPQRIDFQLKTVYPLYENLYNGMATSFVGLF